MAKINENHEKIGGFGFQELRYWHGKSMSDIFDAKTDVWEFFRCKAVALSQGEEAVKYTPCAANIALIHCLENNISALHLAPRQSNMTNTVLLYIYYLLEIKHRDDDCLIYYLTRNSSDFDYQMSKLKLMASYIAGTGSITFKATYNARMFNRNRSMVEDRFTNYKVDIHSYLKKDGATMNKIKYYHLPTYIFVEDALHFYNWEELLPTLKALADDGRNITVTCLSTLNGQTNTAFRKKVQQNLMFDTTNVFFNGEIFYEPIPENTSIENPVIVYNDFRYIHKDKANDFRNRMQLCIDNSDIIMQEVYLQYPSVPTIFLGR